ncbi:hypothetical protein RCL1_005622 [Eukaryota sp. TZLM3-RCL]
MVLDGRSVKQCDSLIAGHHDLIKTFNSPWFLFKPLVTHEYTFYQLLRHYPQYQFLVPRYFGCVEYLENTYICLSDLTYGMKYPCVMDLKMGVRQYGDDAKPDKIERMKAKVASTTSSTLGVRFCGYSIWNRNGSINTKRDKFLGRKLSQQGVNTIVKSFFASSNSEIRLDVVEALLDKVESFYDFFRSLGNNRAFRFYSTSLLLVYDADPLNLNLTNCAIIDFAHTHLTANLPIDDGYELGLSTVINVLREILLNPSANYHVADENDLFQ